MNPTFAGFLYLGSAVAFIRGLRLLSSPATARRGNRIAAVGMLVAVTVTVLDRQIVSYKAIGVGILLGTVIGVVVARRVAMTAMPQLIAAFNGFGGGASALVAVVEILRLDSPRIVTLVSVTLSVLVGAVTFSGSMIAYGKLADRIPGHRITLPAQSFVDGILLLVVLGAAVWLVVGASVLGVAVLSIAALALGVTRTLPIGGADMPVVISFLNALSGVAASMAGFVVESNALIISGALVGASGLILTTIMVKAMNRSLGNVLFSRSGGPHPGAETTGDRVARRASAEDVAIMVGYASRVVVVPGYGLAVAQAQHTVRELAGLLEKRGVDVRFGIHPVAGRMPGHMNVLLAEADVSYDRLADLGEINPELASTDVALVVGANDVVNTAARDDPSSPVYGMPIIDVDHARTVVVIKRSLSPGFAGIDNPLFYRSNTVMLFADAKEGLGEVVAALKAL